MTPFSTLVRLPRRFENGLAAIGLSAAIILGHPSARAQSGRAAEHWVGTWATAVVSSQQTVILPLVLQRRQAQQAQAPQRGEQAPQSAPPLQVVNNQTLRQIVHTSLSGSRFRVVLSNAFGTTPLTIGAAHIALHANEASIVPKSGKPLTFDGKQGTTIPAGAVMFSDPVDVPVSPFADLAIDVYVPGDTAGSPLTTHSGALQTNYVSEAGNHTGVTELPVAQSVSSWFFLARVEVAALQSVGAVVTFGDSITDGNASTPNTNRRWPDDFARRLVAGSGSAMGVLNLGISGNRLLSDGFGVSALARFDRDVAAQTGVTHVVVLEGINDIGFGGDDPLPTAADLIVAHRQLIARARARGLKIYGATLTPFEGAAYQTAVGEGKRQEFNKWIRTSRAYDGVIDFDAAVRDPKEPTKQQAAYDPGDHLHFTDAGYQAMAEAVSLNFFKKTVVKTSGSR